MRVGNAAHGAYSCWGTGSATAGYIVERKFVEDSELLTEASCTAKRFAFLPDKGTLDTT